jgi:hypothetical protein
MSDTNRPIKLTSVPPPLPDWLSAVPDDIAPPPPTNPYLLAEINHMIYENMLPIVLSKVAAGMSIARVMREAQRGPERAEYVRWLMKDPKRKAAYYEAKAIGAEVLDDQCIDIADGISEDGNEIMEDIARSKLRIDERRKSMSIRDRKRFGDTKQIEINQTISITDALRDAQARVATIIDAEVIEPKQLEDDSDA